MVEPILNSTNVTILKTNREPLGSKRRDAAYNEPRSLTKERVSEVIVKGQVSQDTGKDFADRRVTRIGDEPQYDIEIIFKRTELVLAGLWGNTDSADDLSKGDIVKSYEAASGSEIPLGLEIDNVKPWGPDFFSGENQFLFVSAFCVDHTEKTGTL